MRAVLTAKMLRPAVCVVNRIRMKSRLATRARHIFALVAFATAFQLSVGNAQQSPVVQKQLVTRSFPIVQVQIGEVPVAIPKDWVETKFVKILSDKDKTISIVNANLRQPPRSTHFDVPPLALFDAVGVPPGVVEQNLRSAKINLKRRWPERVADADGFWHWKPGQYVLINSTHARPLDQPLIVSCSRSVRPNQTGEQRCGVLFYTSELFVRYDFFDTDVPKSHWAELDQRVLALVDFLDGRKVWPAGK